MIYVCIFFFSIWFVLSIINQIDHKLVQGIKQNDIFHVLPRWTFFAPNPGFSDYHLLFRHKLATGEISHFKEISLTAQKNLLSAVWHPGKRTKKALSDLVRDLSR